MAREAAVASSPQSPPWASAGSGHATPWTPPPPLPLSALHAAGAGDAAGGGGGLSPHGSPLIGVIRERVDGFERLGRERNSLQASMGSPGRAALSAPVGGGPRRRQSGWGRPHWLHGEARGGRRGGAGRNPPPIGARQRPGCDTGLCKRVRGMRLPCLGFFFFLSPLLVSYMSFCPYPFW